MKNRIILASASPRRREILDQIGMEFEVIPSGADETTGSSVPYEMVMELSARKAQDIFDKLTQEQRSSVLVVGADTVVAVSGRILGKPKDEDEAREMLSLIQGRTHQVYTGVTLIWWNSVETGAHGGTANGKTITGAVMKKTFFEKTDVTMYPMTMEEICAYVKTGEPLDKAGAYAIQGKCAVYVKEIHGDYYNVVGLPAARLYQEIKFFLH